MVSTTYHRYTIRFLISAHFTPGLRITKSLPNPTPQSQITTAHLTIPRYAITCEWTCRAHVIWHGPANVNGEISVDETGVYEGVALGEPILKTV